MTTTEKTRKSGTRGRSARRPLTPPAASVKEVPILSDAIVKVAVCESRNQESGTRDRGPETRDQVSGNRDQGCSEPGSRGPRNVRELLEGGLGHVELLSFRVGREMFAIDLACVEEAVESHSVHTVPDMPGAMLGVIELRGRLVPVFSPSHVLRAELSGGDGVMLVMRAGDRRVGIAVDDVEDVIVVDMPALRRPVLDDASDGLLLGVAATGAGLVGILDGRVLVAACAGNSVLVAA